MLVDWYEKNSDKLHPFVLASIFHMQFELIHPFGDGNGRVGRLLMNMILQQNHFMPVTILEKTKQNYYRALENRSIHQFLLHTLTAFIEEDVPDVEENPHDYLDRDISGVLHRVRYAKPFFFDLVERSGYRISDFQHRGISRTNQSVLVAKKMTQ